MAEVPFDRNPLVDVPLGVPHGIVEVADVLTGDGAPLVPDARLLGLGQTDHCDVLVLDLARRCVGRSGLPLDLTLEVPPLLAVPLDVDPLAPLVLWSQTKPNEKKLSGQAARERQGGRREAGGGEGVRTSAMARAAYLATSSAEVPSSFALRSSAARVLSSFCFSSAVFKLALSSATIPSFPVSLAYRAASKMSWITVSAAVTSWSLSEASFSKRMRYEVDGGPAVEAAACLASSARRAGPAAVCKTRAMVLKKVFGWLSRGFPRPLRDLPSFGLALCPPISLSPSLLWRETGAGIRVAMQMFGTYFDRKVTM